MFKIREKRLRFRPPCIKVRADEVVSYEDSTVKVLRGDVLLHMFGGIKVLHVHNSAEGYQSFSDTAKGRLFPGFGRLLSQQIELTIFGML